MSSCFWFASAGLRHVFLLSTLIAVLCCAGCADPLPPEHAKAISKFQGLGGKVNFYQGGYLLNLRNSRLDDADLKALVDIQDLVVLDLRDTRITDKGLEEIAKLPKLTDVHLEGTMVTPEGVDALRKKRPDLSVR